MSSAQKPIVVVGSINTDLVARADRIPIAGETILGKDFHIHPGGKGANQAIAVARLGYPVRMIGRLGTDVFGEQLRTYLDSAGVNVEGVIATEGSSGVALIVVSSDGQNSIVVAPGANALVSPADIEMNIGAICGAGAVLAQLEIPIDTVEYLARICRREGIPLILDPAPAAELSAQLLRGIAWFTPNETEAGFYLGTPREQSGSISAENTARILIGKGINGIVLKLGDRGVYVASSRDEAKQVPAFPVNAIDTTAAGDAFNGAFATGLMMGKGPIESARFAAGAAAISVTRFGAQPSMPSLAEVEKLIDNSVSR